MFTFRFLRIAEIKQYYICEIKTQNTVNALIKFI